MSLEVEVHGAQVSILRELLFHREAGFAELQKPTGLTSDHFSFHIARLVDVGLVDKVSRGTYRLSHRGKEYANKLDTDERKIERQPKVAVILAAERITNRRHEFLFQERLKNPYYGYWGFPSGKIRWGETILETAARELKEETGLTANFELMGQYHEHTYMHETGELLEDKMFHVVRAFDVQGELISQFEGGRNVWMTAEEITDYNKKYSSFETEFAMVRGKTAPFVHEIHEYTKEEF
jgi:8-oxo-dGTP pyrophosphatase MutT (NUDIX family)